MPTKTIKPKRAPAKKPKPARAPTRASTRPSTLDDLLARDILHAPIVSVPVSAPIADVQQVLADNRISGVPVTNEAGRIVGVISAKDLLDRYAEEGEPAVAGRPSYYATSDDTEEVEHFERDEAGTTLTAADVMTPEVYSVPATTRLRVLAKRMVEWNVHRVMVLERGRHIGLISTMDVLSAVATSR